MLKYLRSHQLGELLKTTFAKWIATMDSWRLCIPTKLKRHHSISTTWYYTNPRKKGKFNQYFSKFRVRVENCFGKLKERFSSLKVVRFRLYDEENYNASCRWILACCVLHNILQEFYCSEADFGVECAYPE